MAPPIKTLQQYESEAIRQPNGCLIHSTGVARKVYQMRHGEINNPKIAVCHTCDNPLCIEDSHHFLGSWKDNIDDAVRKGRHSCFANIKLAQANSPLTHSDETKKKISTKIRGANHPQATITEEQAKKIKDIIKSTPKNITPNYANLAKDLGVSYATFMNIKCNKTWRHIK